MKTVGSKYEQVKNMDIKDIAKLVRADLKKVYPQYRFSVRIDRFAMGQRMDVVIKDSEFERSGRTPEARRLENEVLKIVDQYNYDDSDSMSDHFDVNFYTNVRVASYTGRV